MSTCAGDPNFIFAVLTILCSFEWSRLCSKQLF